VVEEVLGVILSSNIANSRDLWKFVSMFDMLYSRVFLRGKCLKCTVLERIPPVHQHFKTVYSMKEINGFSL